ncbi:hypothetical protein OHA25_48345 [Nonomuraea sp. NBC_00507]|uniref:hypothetical protein n=1 Tax=Nonomuraea sp. NBC_00507 TaxID=2976002 RepID=UPI002E1707A7
MLLAGDLVRTLGARRVLDDAPHEARTDLAELDRLTRALTEAPGDAALLLFSAMC